MDKKIKILNNSKGGECLMKYSGRPDNYGKFQRGFENHVSSKDVEELERITDEYVKRVNEVVDKQHKAISEINLEFKIEPFSFFRGKIK